MTQISTWLQFALQQMAAESYLDRILSGELQLEQALRLGNNRVSGALASDPILPGKTRMTDQQMIDFSARYDIVDHHANDATGFSATLMQERGTNNYTLSFRSTEYRDQSEGGDYERDGVFAAPLTFAADGEIGAHGFAFGRRKWGHSTLFRQLDDLITV